MEEGMYQKVDTKELIGQRFGKLLVQEYSHFKNNKHYYKCLCDCGKTYISHRGRLLSGGSVSCGCDRPYRPDPKELIGKRFGKLIVLDDLGTDVSKKRRVRYYRCRCDCGKEIETSRTRLLNGEVVSCGNCTSIEKEGDYYRYTCLDGNSFIFDGEDLELVRSYRWYMSNGYPVTRSNGGKYRKLTRLMFGIADEPDMDVDHIDGDPGNERRSNLRLSGHRKNMWNTKLRKGNKSGYKGVSFDSEKQKFQAQIVENKNYHFLGYYHNPEEAARAYDEAARLYFGEFACVNFPRPGEQCCRRHLADTAG